MNSINFKVYTLLFGVLWQLCGCSVALHHDLDEDDANRIIVILSQQGIAAAKESQRKGRNISWKVVVAESDATRAWRVLRAHKIPRRRPKGLELFNGRGLIQTANESRAMMQRALSGELTRMLLALPRVVDARVLVSLLPRQRIVGSSAPYQAGVSILIRYRKEAGGAQFPLAAVKRLAAAAIPGLSMDKVAVVALPQVLVSHRPAVRLIKVGPFAVAEKGSRSLRIMFFFGAGLISLLALALIWWIIKMRRLRRRLSDLEARLSALNNQ